MPERHSLRLANMSSTKIHRQTLACVFEVPQLSAKRLRIWELTTNHCRRLRVVSTRSACYARQPTSIRVALPQPSIKLISDVSAKRGEKVMSDLQISVHDNGTDQRGPGVDYPFVKTNHRSSVASDGYPKSRPFDCRFRGSDHGRASHHGKHQCIKSVSNKTVVGQVFG
ncbi:hypothetical protein CA13_66530 [Planctomycetes bacterium CA13]|uniref:Uncharacterized protein n=1 Tax=Novipirellula herctigrandis TaxID=2527986 RepID=A0A5C5ZEA0_9BACT|nr:hypothetical protein CA13_66530 [Planctomycetes bacterium CA13]